MEAKRDSDRLNKAIREFESRLKEQFVGVEASVLIDSGLSDEDGNEEVAFAGLTPWEVNLEFSRGQGGWGLRLASGEADDLKYSELAKASRRTRINAMRNFEHLLRALEAAQAEQAKEEDEAIRQVELLTRSLVPPASSRN